ncbi:hypothetical protein [Streptomyces sp. NPDC005568]|uniref:hypothetical protein n=1 Tax=Streptomyces sp. NPDC005568 TaxID=3156887 RepID=UPI0033A0592D
MAGGVVQQFGDGEDQRVHDRSGHRHVRRPADAYPAVVADAGGRAAHDVGERGGVPPPLGRGPAEHGQGTGAAGEAGVGVVDAEQVAEDVRVVVPVLHRGDGGLLLVGEVEECARRLPEDGTGAAVRARPGLSERGGEPLQHAVEARRETGAGEARVEGPGVHEGAGGAGRRGRTGRCGPVGRGGPGTSPGLRQGLGPRQAHRDQVPYLFLPGPQALREPGGAVAVVGGGPAQAYEEEGQGQEPGGQEPARRVGCPSGHGSPSAPP